ncbi:MAG TPA: type II toxin-antitoxin system RelE/ParE family toxin [Solirubrobacteraceae bacterium]|nr:type II toxin-antitoxin system RelE/ParE family toxin [Solirubrobacteraceae bacterium]
MPGGEIITRGKTIDIGWLDRKLKRNCSSDRAGQRIFGPEQWTVLKRRIVSLEAAPTLAALEGVPGRFHELSADRAGQFSLDLRGAYRLIFTPDHDPVPTLAEGGINRSLVTKVVIVEVVDHHGR